MNDIIEAVTIWFNSPFLLQEVSLIFGMNIMGCLRNFFWPFTIFTNSNVLAFSDYQEITKT